MESVIDSLFLFFNFKEKISYFKKCFYVGFVVALLETKTSDMQSEITLRIWRIVS